MKFEWKKSDERAAINCGDMNKAATFTCISRETEFQN